MNRIIILALFLTVCSARAIFAQPTYQNRYSLKGDSSGALVPRCMTLATDGGLLVAASYAPDTIYNFFWTVVYKLDSLGEVEWSTMLGDTVGSTVLPGGYTAASVAQTSDNGYALLGSGVSDKYCVAKLDSDGKLLWSGKYAAHLPKSAQSANSSTTVAATTDGGMYIQGTMASAPGSVGYSAALMRLDSVGKVVWSRCIWDPYYDGGVLGTGWPSQTKVLSDGGVIICGTTVGDSNEFSERSFLIRMSPSGQIVWDKAYSAGIETHGASVTETTDGGFVVLGSDYNQSATPQRIFKVDSVGDVRWDRMFYSDTACVASTEICALPNGNFVCVSTYFSSVADLDTHAILTTFSPDGIILRSVEMQNPVHTLGTAVSAFPDGRIALLTNIVKKKTYGGASFSVGVSVLDSLSDGCDMLDFPLLSSDSGSAINCHFQLDSSGERVLTNPVRTFPSAVEQAPICSDNRRYELLVGPVVAAEASVVPNPVQSGQPVVVALRDVVAGKYRISISDVSGRRLYDESQWLSAGTQRVSLEMKGFPSGSYFISVDSEPYGRSILRSEVKLVR